MREGAGRRIETIETPTSAYPQEATPVLVDGMDRTVAKAGRIVRSMYKTCERPRLRVETVESAPLRSNPQRAMPVCEKGTNIAVAEAGRIQGII